VENVYYFLYQRDQLTRRTQIQLHQRRKTQIQHDEERASLLMC